MEMEIGNGNWKWKLETELEIGNGRQPGKWSSNLSEHQAYRREPATHILVVLISPEERNKKPYALAVQS